MKINCEETKGGAQGRQQRTTKHTGENYSNQTQKATTATGGQATTRCTDVGIGVGGGDRGHGGAGRDGLRDLSGEGGVEEDGRVLVAQDVDSHHGVGRGGAGRGQTFVPH